MNLADIYRLSDTKRWQIVKTAKPQSVAEHMYAVAMIGRRIATGLELPDHLVSKVVEWSLWHDVPEVYTGDIATPVKNHMRQVCSGDPLAGLEDHLCGEEYVNVREHTTSEPLVARIVKLADVLESIKFLTQNSCTDHGVKVRGKLVKARDQLIVKMHEDYPEHDWSHKIMCVHYELTGPETSVDDLL